MPVEPEVRPPRQHVAAAQQGIDRQPQPRSVLGDHRGRCRAGHAPPQHQYEQQVQPHVQQGRAAQKPQRCGGVARRAQQAGEEVMEERGRQPYKNDAQITGHVAVQRIGHLQKPQDGVQQDVYQRRHRRSHPADEAEGQRRRPMQRRHVLPAQIDGEQCPCAHGQSQKHGGQERHQREGGAHRCQGVAAQRTPHDESVRYIIQLLEKASRHHGQREQQQAAGDAAAGHVPIHKNSSSGKDGGRRLPSFIVVVPAQ